MFLDQVQAQSHRRGSPTQSRAIRVTKIQVDRGYSERLNELETIDDEKKQIEGLVKIFIDVISGDYKDQLLSGIQATTTSRSKQRNIPLKRAK